jgi:hypothetical protein
MQFLHIIFIPSKKFVEDDETTPQIAVVVSNVNILECHRRQGAIDMKM